MRSHWLKSHSKRLFCIFASVGPVYLFWCILVLSPLPSFVNPSPCSLLSSSSSTTTTLSPLFSQCSLPFFFLFSLLFHPLLPLSFLHLISLNLFFPFTNLFPPFSLLPSLSLHLFLFPPSLSFPSFSSPLRTGQHPLIQTVQDNVHQGHMI